MRYLVPRLEPPDRWLDAERLRYEFGEGADCGGLVRPDVEDLSGGASDVDTVRDQWRHVVDVRKGTHLAAVAEDRHRLALHHLVHEDSDDVPVAIADVLMLPVDVVG